MIRTLLVIFFVGLLVSAAGFAGAAALGDSHGWSWKHGPFHWAYDSEARNKDEAKTMAWPENAGPMATRQVVWKGDEDLVVNVPADVTYVQSAESGVLITGPKNRIDLIKVEEGRISLPDSSGRMRWGRKDGGDIRIEVRAPNVKSFELNGAQQLVISGYKQDRLEIAVHGAANVVAVGEARRLDVEMNGAGKGDFGKLITLEAELQVNGAGEIIAGPTESVDAEINGVGAIKLLTRPPEMKQAIHGIGSVVVEDPKAPIAPRPSSPAVKPAHLSTT